jgi:type III secretion protein U
MSGQPSQAKTEQPTIKRLRDLRKKGDVPKSADVPATVAVLAMVVYFSFAGDRFLTGLTALLEKAATADFRTLDSPASVADWVRGLLLEGLHLVWPVILVLVVASALAGFLQVGGVFSFEAIQPQLSRISPMQGLRRVFSRNSVIELIKLFVKTLMLIAIVWLLGRQLISTLLQSHWLNVAQLLPLSMRVLALLSWVALCGFLAITIFDVWFQRWDYRRRNMMTIEEVRREHREQEGDPQIRSRRRQLHQEVSNATMLQNLRRANVVVVNPTHIAVALYYEAGETDLPIVVAKGEGELAREIRRIAEEEGIPIMQNVDLARRLQATATVDQYIPDELIEPVAEVLRWAQSIGRGES